MVGDIEGTDRQGVGASPTLAGGRGRTTISRHRLAAAGGVRFEVIAGRNLLFSAATQRLFEINDTAAYLWRSVEHGLGRDAIRDEMVERGLAPEAAEDCLDTAIQEWTQLGLMRSVPGPDCGPGDDAPPIQDIRVAGVATRLRHAPRLAPHVAPIFAHLEAAGERPEVMLDVVGDGEHFDLFRDGELLSSCSGAEIATVLKAQILDEVLERGAYAVALHAAALVRNGRMLLLCGHPGAGKTTLALALVQAGFGFAGDDLALLDPQGQVTGVPFSPAVKAGAWKLVAACRPDILDSPIFRRPDGMRVRYPPPHGLAPARPHPVGWMVLLDRRAGTDVALMPSDPPSAVRWMLQDAYTRDRRLTTAGFRAIGRSLAQARYHRLTYSSLEDAVGSLDRLCR